MSKLAEVASWYYNVLGLNIVLLKAKKPIDKWRELAYRRQTEEEFESLQWDIADGFALIGGSKVLGGLHLCAIDYDVKELPKDVVDRGGELLKMLPKTRVEKTPSGGQHWLYLCKKEYPYTKRYHGCCAIEILGASWLTIMYPSTGYYVLDDTPIAMVEDFELLIEEMQKFDNKKPITNKLQNNNNLVLVSGYPSCVLEAVEELARTGELDHEERLFLSSYLINVMDDKGVMDIIKVAKDFSYSKTLYQIGWLRRSNYRPCKCDKVMELGLCKGKCELYPYPLGGNQIVQKC